MRELRTEILTEFRSLEKLADQWDALWKGGPRPTAFGSFAWARASWNTWGSEQSLCTPVVFQDDRVVGILPLVTEGTDLRFLGGRSDYNDMLCDSTIACEVVEAAVRALSSSPTQWRRGTLNHLPEESPVVKYFGGLKGRAKLYSHLAHEAVCASVVLDDDPEETLKAILKKKTFRSYENKLRRQGELNFRHLESREEIDAHLPIFFNQHIARWAMAGLGSLFQTQRNREFYTRLTRELDPREALRFGVLELDGRPIGYHFGFEHGGTFIYYKPTFDVDFWQYSPGQVLLKRLLQYVGERNLREFDFTGGDETYKRRFANRITPVFTLQFFSGGVRSYGRVLNIRARAHLENRPFAARTVRNTRDAVRKFREKVNRGLRRYGTWGFAKAMLRTQWRRFIFSRDVLLVFAYDAEETPEREACISLEPGTLGELAHMASEHPEQFSAANLAKARDRLKRGDCLHIARKGDQCAHVAWTGIRDEIATWYPGQRQCRIALEQPVTLISNDWTPPAMRGQGIYPEVLKTLVAKEQSRQCWICCFDVNRASRRGIEKAGFRLKHRMKRIRLFGWFVLDSVSSCGD